MIKVWELHAFQKEIREVSIEKWQVGKTLSWVDCYQPSEREFQLLSQKTGIPAEELKDSIHPAKRPHVIPYDGYSLIIFRAPHEVHGQLSGVHLAEVSTTPVGVFMFKNDVITIHNKKINALEEFRKLPKQQLMMIFTRGAPYFVYRFMDAAIGDFFEVMDQLEDNIGAIEDEVLESPRAAVTKKIFMQKRTLIYSHKALVANRDVLSALEKQYISDFKREDMKVFRDLYNDTAQLLDLVATYREILTSILDMYLSSVSNNLNRTVKTLTALSAFVMIPTLIASIYGMNFHDVSPWNMPELYWKYGYFFALGLMVLSLVIVYIWFKRKDWL